MGGSGAKSRPFPDSRFFIVLPTAGGFCLVFLLLAGLLLLPALYSPGGVLRFYGFFLPAFMLYAIAW